MHFTRFFRLTTALAAAGLAFAPLTRGAAASGTAPATGSAHATSKAPETAAPPVAKVTVTFRTNGMHGGVQNVYYKSAGQTFALSAQDSATSSATYSYTGNPTMEFLRPGGADAAMSSPAGSGNGRRGGRGIPSGPMAVVGSVTFPKSGNYTLYMTETSGGVGAAALSDDTSQFPIGSLRVVNTTKYPMAVMINDAFVPLKVYASMLIPFSGDDQFRLLVQRTDLDSGNGVVNSPVAKPSPGLRTTGFILVGNPLQVLNEQADPNFNIFFVSDNGKPDKAAPQATGGAGRPNAQGSGGSGRPQGQGNGTGRNRRATGG